MKAFTGASVIITALNETTTLENAVDIVLNTCHHEDLQEIIIALAKVSTEECVQTANAVCKKDGGVSIRTMVQNKPYIGGAFEDAFEMAAGSHVVMLAADMDTDPAVVCKFIEQSKRHPDCVITANRWIKGGGFVGYSKLKKVCNFIFNRIFAIFYLTNLTDMTYGFRLLPADLVKSIRWEEQKHPFYFETALKPLRLGVKFVEVPAVWRSTGDGQSVNSFFQNFAYFKTAFHNRFLSKEKIMK